MNNAMVTLPLSEVDALRNKLEQAEYKVSQLEVSQMKIKVEMRERGVEIDSRYVQTNFGAGKFQEYFQKLVWHDHPHTYINMDEVIKPIRDEEEAKVATYTRKLEQNFKELTEKFEKAKTGFKDEIKHLNEKHLEALAIAKGETLDQSKERVMSTILEKNRQLSEECANQELQLLQMEHQGFFGRLFHPIRRAVRQ